MRKKARLLPFHLLPLCSDVLLRSKAADCPAAWGILHAASHVMLMPQLRHGPALPLDGRIRCEEKTDAFPNRASTFLRESIRRICSYRLTSPSIRLTEFVHDNMRNFRWAALHIVSTLVQIFAYVHQLLISCPSSRRLPPPGLLIPCLHCPTSRIRKHPTETTSQQRHRQNHTSSRSRCPFCF
ncbi:hypothetical protein CSPX01_12676 [Colletotrichum filicis]|nr:hypothetical protein CSPX01_12676 [Colletotrichum filicis]